MANHLNNQIKGVFGIAHDKNYSNDRPVFNLHQIIEQGAQRLETKISATIIA